MMIDVGSIQRMICDKFGMPMERLLFDNSEGAKELRMITVFVSRYYLGESADRIMRHFKRNDFWWPFRVLRAYKASNVDQAKVNVIINELKNR